MAQQAIIVYISQEGGEINDLSNLVSELVTELDWVGTLNGQDVPIKIRLSEEPADLEDEDPDVLALVGMQRERYDALVDHVGHDAALKDARQWPGIGS